MYRNKGFTIYVAIILVTTLLTIGIGVLNITLRELVLTSVGKESLKAFFAADAGLDCAFYHDTEDPLVKYYADPVRLYTGLPMPTNGTQVMCNNQFFHIGPAGSPGGSGYECFLSGNPTHLNDYCRTNFTPSTIPGSELDLLNATCARITVEKRIVELVGLTPIVRTQIRSDGLNTCISGTPRRVQRTLILRWKGQS